MVALADVIVVLNATPVCATKLNASGVVSPAASVVAQNEPVTPPTVSVAQVCVPLLADEVRPTLTVFPLATVDAALPKGPPLTEYVPPATLIGAGALIPEIVAPTDVMVVFSATPVCAGKLNASGVVSMPAARVVAQNEPVTPPMFSVAQVCAL
jgi:hypothetical protein